MTQSSFTLIDEQKACEVSATITGESVRLAPETVSAALGWKLEDRGLCRGSVCIPTAGAESLATAEGIDLAILAKRLGRPLALDLEHRVAALAAAPGDRGAALASLEAPDFALPDLEGRHHSLSEHRGKKVLLVAYASW
jgi:hypothetical protein